MLSRRMVEVASGACQSARIVETVASSRPLTRYGRALDPSLQWDICVVGFLQCGLCSIDLVLPLQLLLGFPLYTSSCTTPL